MCEDTEHCDEPGVDCWGFRPRHKLVDYVDIVGIIMQNGWTRWTAWEEDGKLLVAGDTEEWV